VLKRLALAVAVAGLVACGSTSRAVAGVHLHRILTGLDQPTYLTAPPGDSRLFIVQKTGKILVDRNGKLLARPFLNLQAKVSTTSEEGLLSMAFDPHYGRNGWVYVSYDNVNGDSRIVRYRVEPHHPNIASPTSAKILLKLHQPFDNHKGGQIAFGRDGLLYAGFGDGGSEGDPNHVGQRRTGLLSKIVRLNVYAKHPVAKIYARGFRNPWRFSFDRANGTLWIGDVGQDSWEEVDKVPFGTAPGGNYGWSYYEGTHVYNNGNGNPKPTGRVVFPVIQYPHVPASGPANCAVTGGYVYRGSSIPSLKGYYVYGDYCSGRIWRRRASGGRPVEMAISRKVANISSFGQGAAGGLYVISLNGSIYRIIP
jgi:glucose/arabinose dehydrogenase